MLVRSCSYARQAMMVYPQPPLREAAATPAAAAMTRLRCRSLRRRRRRRAKSCDSVLTPSRRVSPTTAATLQFCANSPFAHALAGGFVERALWLYRAAAADTSALPEEEGGQEEDSEEEGEGSVDEEATRKSYSPTPSGTGVGLPDAVVIATLREMYRELTLDMTFLPSKMYTELTDDTSFFSRLKPSQRSRIIQLVQPSVRRSACQAAGAKAYLDLAKEACSQGDASGMVFGPHQSIAARRRSGPGHVGRRWSPSSYFSLRLPPLLWPVRRPGSLCLHQRVRCCGRRRPQWSTASNHIIGCKCRESRKFFARLTAKGEAARAMRLVRAARKECGHGCACASRPDRCTNRQMQRGLKKRLKVKLCDDKDKGWPVFTAEHINPGEFVVEYVGELISEEEVDRRAK